MAEDQSVDRLFREAAQRAEAGVGGWDRISAKLQLGLTSEKGATRYWSISKEGKDSISESSSYSPSSPLLEVSREDFIEIVAGRKNIEQAYRNKEVAVWGALPEALLFTRVFDELQGIWKEVCDA